MLVSMTEERVSRGRLLKKAGAGALVLGAGSMLTSSAYAVAPPLDVCIQQAVDEDVAACGQCASQTACGAGCGCVPTTQGCCFCHQGIGCAGATPCRYRSQCPPGWACAAATCCGPFGICVPPCGGAAAAVATAGPMSIPA
jgi:hypothetical protein